MPERRIRKCLEQNMYVLGENNDYKVFKRIIDPQGIQTLITFKDSNDKMDQFVADVHNLNRFHIDGNFSLDIVYTETSVIESERISYTGQLYLEDVSLHFEYSRNNICKITFHTYYRDEEVDITDSNINRDDLKGVIEDFEEIGRKYFT